MTVFDALLIAVIGISMFFAAVRGGLREMATLTALAIAALAGWLLIKPVATLTGKDSFFVNASVAGLIGAAVFLGSYILMHKALLRWKPSARARQFDRIGGGAFGMVRALALIGLGFLGYGYYLDEANQPDSVKKALLLPVAASAAGFFEQFAPPNRDLSASKEPKNAAAEGYDGQDRSGLKEIMTTVTTTDSTMGATTGAAARSAPADPIADILNEETASDDNPQ